MHSIVVTPGIVLAKRPLSEASTTIALLTKKEGLIRASARSARAEASKLRFGLEPLMRGRFSLVRGRYDWKLVGAEHLSSEYFPPFRVKRASLGRVSKLLLRLIPGEEPLPQLFHAVEDGFAAIAASETENDIEYIECVLVLQVLSFLGYVENTSAVAPYLQNVNAIDMLERARGEKRILVRAINEALGATGL